MANLLDLYADVGANIIGDDSVATFTVKNVSTGNVLDLRSLGADTVILDAYASGASIAILGLHGINKGYVSTNSTGSIAYAMRVAVGGTNNYWIPIYTGIA